MFHFIFETCAVSSHGCMLCIPLLLNKDTLPNSLRRQLDVLTTNNHPINVIWDSEGFPLKFWWHLLLRIHWYLRERIEISRIWLYLKLHLKRFLFWCIKSNWFKGEESSIWQSYNTNPQDKSVVRLQHTNTPISICKLKSLYFKRFH